MRSAAAAARPVAARLLSRYVFWLAVFAAGRTAFFLTHAADALALGWAELGAAFRHGLALDTATAAYLMVPACLAVTCDALWPSPVTRRALWGFELAAVWLVAITSAADAAVYGEWGTKLGYQALTYLARPAEIVESATGGLLAIGGLHACVLGGVGSWALRRGVHRRRDERAPGVGRAALLPAAVAAVALAIAMRGGLGQIPIHQSDAYFSTSDTLNLGAVNPLWNVVHSLRANRRAWSARGLVFYPEGDAQRLVGSLHDAAPPRSPRLLAVPRPNIVVVLLESWSAEFVAGLGNEADLTPGFAALTREGLLFERHYAAGTLSHHGVGAVLSGLPTSPLGSPVAQPDRYPDLPHLARDLRRAGYETAFLFGGQLSYGNIKAYLHHGGFDHLVEERDFAADVPRGRLSVHDEHLFRKVLDEVPRYREPFFAVAFTASSHSPYDHPGPRLSRRGDGSDAMRDAVRYADASVSAFVEAARRAPWYGRTLFVFVADHAHPSTARRSGTLAEARRIPLLLCGPALDARAHGVRERRLVAQYDVPALLLRELGLDDSRYVFSRDPLAPGPRPAVLLGANDGVAWLRAGEEGQARLQDQGAMGAAPPEVRAVLQVLTARGR